MDPDTLVAIGHVELVCVTIVSVTIVTTCSIGRSRRGISDFGDIDRLAGIEWFAADRVGGVALPPGTFRTARAFIFCVMVTS